MINGGVHGFHSLKKLFLIINLEIPAYFTFLALFLIPLKHAQLLFVSWTVLFWTAMIPQVKGFVFDDKVGVSCAFDISSHF